MYALDIWVLSYHYYTLRWHALPIIINIFLKILRIEWNVERKHFRSDSLIWFNFFPHQNRVRIYIHQSIILYALWQCTGDMLGFFFCNRTVMIIKKNIIHNVINILLIKRFSWYAHSSRKKFIQVHVVSKLYVNIFLKIFSKMTQCFPNNIFLEFYYVIFQCPKFLMHMDLCNDLTVLYITVYQFIYFYHFLEI